MTNTTFILILLGILTIIFTLIIGLYHIIIKKESTFVVITKFVFFIISFILVVGVLLILLKWIDDLPSFYEYFKNLNK